MALVVGVIPARGGSKGIPGKNLVDLGGLPLLAHTCRAALASSELDHVVCSTEDKRIQEIAEQYGVEVLERPPSLAADGTPMIEVLQHVLAELRRERSNVEMVVLLQPTSPLRSTQDIDEAIRRHRDTRATTVVSVVRVPHNFTPGSLMTLEEAGTLRPLMPDEKTLRRQDKATLYARNGPAVLVTRASVIDGGELYGEATVAYEMPPERSVDIDTAEDLHLARCLWSCATEAEEPDEE